MNNTYFVYIEDMDGNKNEITINADSSKSARRTIEKLYPKYFITAVEKSGLKTTDDKNILGKLR